MHLSNVRLIDQWNNDFLIDLSIAFDYIDYILFIFAADMLRCDELHRL